MTVDLHNKITDVYFFELDNINSSLHSHPTVELVFSPTPNFSIYTESCTFSGSQAYFIKSGVKHSLFCNNSPLTICMIDAITYSELSLISKLNLVDKPIQEIPFSILTQLRSVSFMNTLLTNYHYPISSIVSDIYSSTPENLYNRSMLSIKYGLSPSRISHIIKDSLGISLSTLLGWQKMRIAFHSLISPKNNIQDTAYSSGFYDHPEFSKKFKSFFGVSPFLNYNDSTIIQGY